MLSVSAKTREVKQKNGTGELSGVLYGPKVKSMSLILDLKEFKKIYNEAGSSQLIKVELDGKKYSVLVHDIQQNPMTGELIHVDLYQPILTEEVEVEIPLTFIGEAPAVKDLQGTLVKEFQEVIVRALPESLPHEIEVDVSSLITFENEILVKDLKIPAGVRIMKEMEERIASVLPPQKVEEELEKPIEENVEAVEQVEKEKKEEGEETPTEETK